jgi:hypothetical protein
MKMRFYILIITLLLALSIRPSFAQGNHFSDGATLINPGVGMGAFLFYFPFQNYTPTPTVTVDHAMKQVGSGELGVGFVTGFRELDVRYRSTPAVWSQYVGGATLSYYPDALQGDTYDLYASIHAGVAYNHYNDPKDILESSYSNHMGIYAAAVLGGRYYFTNNIAAFGEAGIDLDWVKVGLSFRLPG